MKTAAHFVFFALLVASGTICTIARAEELRPFEASYDWLWHGMTVASSTVRLEQQGDTWTYSTKSEPRGIGRVFSERPVQKTTMRLTENTVRPLTYDMTGGTSSTQRDVHIIFDWERVRVTGVYETTKVELPLQSGVQDDLSVQIAVMTELLAGRTPELFRLIDKNSFFEYRYTKEGTIALATAIGTVQTVIFRSQKNGSQRVTRFWCAPAQGYIPMRVEQSKNDVVQWSMQIQSLKRE